MRVILFNTLAFFCVFFNVIDSQIKKDNNLNCKIINQNFYTDDQIKSFIVEVFGNKSDELVFNSSSRRYEMIKDFLNNRFKIEYRPEYKFKEFKLLSTLGLNNKYNNALIIDSVIDMSTFNPLKYNFEMNSREKKIYRVDNTDYVITILPIN